jgi:gamma-glutamyltranspeptidase/glutathione hydrolase
MVTSRHPLSAEAGLEILRHGGNAVDAVIAASFAESVVQPAASTIGGGGLLCARLASGSHSVNYMWQTPAAAHAAMFPLEGELNLGLFGWSGVKDQRNEIGGLAAAVPGSVAGLTRAASLCGRLPLSDLLQPAIRLASEGFEMDWYGSLMAANHLDIIKRYPTTARMLLRDGEYPLRPNMIGPADIHRQPELAETLEAISTGGSDAFYSGPIAKSIVDAIQADGGLMTLDDLASYEAQATTPDAVTYRGRTIQGEPSGFAVYALSLNVLSHFDVAALAPDSPARLHLFVEVMRQCRGRVRGARTEDLPQLVTPEYAAWLAGHINPHRRVDAPEAPPSVAPEQTRTVHIAAIDAEGGVASLTETVIGNYGCFVMSETGVLLNNGMIGFAPAPGQANSVTPNKRPSSTMTPILMSDPTDGSVATIGASGGAKIATSVLQILSLMVDHRLSPQAAVSFPRVDLEGPKVILDARFGEAAAAALRSMGHEVERRAEDLSTFEFGNASVIQRQASGVVRAGVNPFQATCAVGFDRT